MSADKLSAVLQQASNWTPSKEEDPDQLVINALERALKATTPERAGCPWDKLEGEDEQEERSGIWLSAGD